jgi:hypothetical protein
MDQCHISRKQSQNLAGQLAGMMGMSVAALREMNGGNVEICK